MTLVSSAVFFGTVEAVSADALYEQGAVHYGRVISVNNEKILFDFDCSGNTELVSFTNDRDFMDSDKSDNGIYRVNISGNCEESYYGLAIGGDFSCKNSDLHMDDIGILVGERYFMIDSLEIEIVTGSLSITTSNVYFHRNRLVADGVDYSYASKFQISSYIRRPCDDDNW